MKEKIDFLFNLKSTSENIYKDYIKNLIKEISTQELKLRALKKIIMLSLFL